MDLLVNIDVDDLDRAVRFYTTALDLRVGRASP
ncbi:VOC family protein, partial [Stutzerimonas azotifigens]